MTPDQHGYVRCAVCFTWRKVADLEPEGTVMRACLERLWCVTQHCRREGYLDFVRYLRPNPVVRLPRGVPLVTVTNLAGGGTAGLITIETNPAPPLAIQLDEPPLVTPICRCGGVLPHDRPCPWTRDPENLE